MRKLKYEKNCLLNSKIFNPIYSSNLNINHLDYSYLNSIQIKMNNIKKKTNQMINIENNICCKRDADSG